ncbi:MAG: hypothetical protein ACJ74O_09485 [Frankiaceae bacterium]
MSPIRSAHLASTCEPPVHEREVGRVLLLDDGWDGWDGSGGPALTGPLAGQPLSRPTVPEALSRTAP